MCGNCSSQNYNPTFFAEGTYDGVILPEFPSSDGGGSGASGGSGPQTLEFPWWLLVLFLLLLVWIIRRLA